MEQSLYEKLGGSYTMVGNYLLPNLIIDEPEQRPIGKYGRMRKRYLKEHRPVFYSNLLVTGKLFQHLAEIDETGEERITDAAPQSHRRQGTIEIGGSPGVCLRKCKKRKKLRRRQDRFACAS